ncbi:MAG: putative molybdenum carrier protein [Verrucomicrobiales bacterium]|nr:putative molybdenum carrier protein [Verrucomicrobiales bacterium]
MWTVQKIVSGGQTGVDRAALEWALCTGMTCGGWCPAGRVAEDGPIDERFPLEETPGEGYSQRTEWNVRDSDGTVLLSLEPRLTGGTQLTKKFARKWNRPCLTLSRAETEDPGYALQKFVETNRIEILNVAGPRETTEADCGRFAAEVLEQAFGCK